MIKIKNKAFTLVELLVVITILAILSVVAYQSFWGATDKAQNTTKKANITTLWNTLWLFFTEENFYPMPQDVSATNLWWYDSTQTASESNTIAVTYNDQEVSTIVTADTAGWWRINWIWANASNQIWAKWVAWINWIFNKKYLKETIYDTQLGEIKLTWETDKKMIDYGIGKFTYALYARPATSANWNVSWSRWIYYTIYTTFKDIEGEWYETYLIWNYSKDNFTNPDDYPEDLIWLKQGQKDGNVATTSTTQGIPYPINNFSK